MSADKARFAGPLPGRQAGSLRPYEITKALTEQQTR